MVSFPDSKRGFELAQAIVLRNAIPLTLSLPSPDFFFILRMCVNRIRKW